MSSAFDLEVSSSGLATLVFDLPDKRVNVFTRTALGELETLIESLSNRRDIRCLVLVSGKDGNFVAGADIDEIADVTDPAVAAEGAKVGQRLFQAWSELPYPTIAAIRATCVGGGTELSLAGDYILISDRDTVRIGLPEVRIGIVPAWGGCSRLPRRTGLAAALDIIVGGKIGRWSEGLQNRTGRCPVAGPDFHAGRCATSPSKSWRVGHLPRDALISNPLFSTRTQLDARSSSDRRGRKS